MIVVDASALVLALADHTAQGQEARRLLTEDHAADQWVAPEHLLLECAQSMRGMRLGGKVAPRDLAVARTVLGLFAVTLVPTRLILDRIWELADNLTVYDAAYVACAELLDAPLLTADRKLVSATGPRCRMVSV